MIKKTKPLILNVDKNTAQHYIRIPVWDIEKITLKDNNLIILLNK